MVLAISPVLEVRLDRVARAAEGKLGRFEAWKKRRVVTGDDVLGGEPTFPQAGSRCDTWAAC